MIQTPFLKNKPNNNTAGKKKIKLNYIDTGILWNETNSEIPQYAAENQHKALLDSTSSVTAVRRASIQ